MEIDLDKIPLFLRRINGWAGFIVEEGTKKPISIIDNKGVGANDFNRLVDFETAAQAVRDGRFDAIGVSLANQKITCIDIDCHSEENRERYKWVSKEILEQFKNTYAETSISGLGTHIFVQAEKPDGYKHSDAYGVVEIYNCVRFMVVTGWQLEDHVTYIGVCQEELNSVCEKYLLKQETFTDTVGQGQYSKSDKEVIEKLEKFRKGKLFLEGRWDEVMKWDQNAGVEIKAFPSQSEADFGFAGLILYINGNNPEQAIRIIKSSGMWDKKRASKKSSDYLKTTVEKASLRCNRVYDWNRTEYTPTEQIIDFDEVMLTYVDNQLVAQARENILCLTTNKELNSYICKYIDNFGTRKKPVITTTHGDFDSAANGVRFFLINQYNLVYLPEGDEWLAWNGKYWDRCYDKHLLSYAENVFYHLKHEAYNIFRDSVLAVDMKKDIEDEALALFKYASTSKGKKECLEMVDFSKSRFVQSQKEQKIFDMVNANLNVLNLQNGVFNLDDMKFYPHERGYFQTKIAGVEYVPDAECPLWCDFLEMVLPNEPIRRYLQKAIGYTISSDCNQKCMFVLYGQNGNNGKTTITKTLYKLMGDYAVAAEKQTIMDAKGQNAGAPRPDLVRLRDRRFVCISESEKGDKLAEGLIKNLVGGNVIICRTLHHEPIEFSPNFKIWLDTNFHVQTSGTDPALYRRLKILPFNYTIPPEKIDLNFAEKLEKELSGILNWAIEGYRLYLSEGLDMPEEMDELIKEYTEDMSPLDQWVKECVGYSDDIGAKCYTSKELYQSYYNWCKFNHEFALGQRRFTQEINMKEWFKATKKVKGYTQYLNVGLNSIGTLFATGDVSDETVFRKKYNEAVNNQIATADAIADWDKALGTFKPIPPED